MLRERPFYFEGYVMVNLPQKYSVVQLYEKKISEQIGNEKKYSEASLPHIW